MYDVQTTKQFDKSFKKCLKRNCNPELLWELSAFFKKPVPSFPTRRSSDLMQYHPHKLSGKFEGLWECHIKSDWLLIWQQNDTELVLIMTDTGTHTDLF